MNPPLITPALTTAVTLSFLTLTASALRAEDLFSPVQAPGPVDSVQISTSPLQLPRAKNLARQAAEQRNGGLANYRAEPAMYGPPTQAPHVDNGDSWTFTFKGGQPGTNVHTTETVVTIAKNGSRLSVDYNGPIRNSTALVEPTPTPVEFDSITTAAPSIGQASDETSLNRAMNLARQAAERANGGIEQYRAEPAMQGPPSQSPYKDNGNSWTFTFKGGPPGAAFTTESVVNVSKDGSQVNVLYNGPIRPGN